MEFLPLISKITAQVLPARFSLWSVATMRTESVRVVMTHHKANRAQKERRPHGQQKR